jgi:hypothetical protein
LGATVDTFTLPKITSYGQYSSSNYGVHTQCVELGPVTVWFSYRTPVAFHIDGFSRVVHRNDWGTTTGKHLNWIDGGDKQSRVAAETFKKLWEEQTSAVLGKELALAD